MFLIQSDEWKWSASPTNRFSDSPNRIVLEIALFFCSETNGLRLELFRLLMLSRNTSVHQFDFDSLVEIFPNLQASNLRRNASIAQKVRVKELLAQAAKSLARHDVFFQFGVYHG
jgi:hypothetical protein